jgi:hypothetical protein
MELELIELDLNLLELLLLSITSIEELSFDCLLSDSGVAAIGFTTTWFAMIGFTTICFARDTGESTITFVSGLMLLYPNLACLLLAIELDDLLLSRRDILKLEVQ